MNPQTFVLLSGTLTFGVPMAVAVWELVMLSADRRGGGDEPPPEPCFPRAPAPLPDCLLPPPPRTMTPVRIRVLEDA